MLFSCVADLNKRNEAEILVLPFWERQKKPKAAAGLRNLENSLKILLESGDFAGSSGETQLLYIKEAKEKRCLVLGLGKEEKLSVDSIRIAYSNAAKECQKKGISKANIVVPNVSELRGITVEQCLKGISEGILLTNYRFEKLFSVKEETVLLDEVSLIGVLPHHLEEIKTCGKIAEGVHFARDLVNGNADIVTPQYLADSAVKIAERFPTVKATIFDLAKIEKEKMGLYLAVAQGSSHEPFFITLSYKGQPKSKDHTVLIGKGVTFDTGGLNLKPTGSIENMRDDMAGAATVLSTIAVAASLNLKVNLTAVVAACENAIDANSFKPGDVFKSYLGTTVEIGNTDAEGRLTLADAISYSIQHLKPTRIIDLATLTGSIVVALGEGMSGLFCNQESLAAALLKSSERTGEILWRMPLHAPYKEALKSDIADIKNVGGRPGGAIVASLFLQEFVQNIPWAHIDIAGTAFANKEMGYQPKNGTGFGVRLLIDFLQNLS